MKKLRSIGPVVFVDYSKKVREDLKLPAEVKAFFGKVSGGIIPKVAIISPDLKRCFGVYDYRVLKSQEYGKIFNEAKKKIKEAKKAGELSFTGKELKKEKIAGVVAIDGTEVEIWQSKQGKEIKAKLIRVEHGELFVLETSEGKTIKVKLNQLSLESADRAKALLKRN
jgi:hypothetical protein